MARNPLLIVLLASAASFALGFFLANSLNKREMEAANQEMARLKASLPKEEAVPELSDEEIRAKIEEARAAEASSDYPKDLGIALYRYARMKKQPEYLPDIIDLLKKAERGRPEDYDLFMAIGNANFDLSELKNKPEALKDASGYYLKALSIKPKDDAALQNLAESLLAQGKTAEAKQYLIRLKAANPNNAGISALERSIEAAGKE